MLNAVNLTLLFAAVAVTMTALVALICITLEYMDRKSAASISQAEGHASGKNTAYARIDAKLRRGGTNVNPADRADNRHLAC
ncbi:MAG: hypothetical protein KTR17_01220 [Cellvibrionaceae bacterium]|nr:hypothetical protein [Cellvibrionaceae bacterium]